jgi:hypothetical protein
MMDLAEIKKHWEEEFEIEDHIVSWLIAEVDRLSTLNESVMKERHEMHDRLLARAEKAEAERDEFKEAYRLAMVSVNHAYDEGRRLGAEDMRERAAKESADMPTPGFASDRKCDGYNIASLDIAAAIRALPIKEAALSAKEGNNGQ